MSKMQSPKFEGVPQRQRGATLVIMLVVLVLIMMLGVAAVNTSITQYKLAGNLQFEDSAMNNAEAAIAGAEGWLSTGTNFNNIGFFGTTVAHLYPVGSAAAILATPLTTAWTNSNSFCVGSSDSNCTDGNPNQRYVIQLLSINNSLIGSSQTVGGRLSSSCNSVNIYQIIGRGSSGRGASKTIQVHYTVLTC